MQHLASHNTKPSFAGTLIYSLAPLLYPSPPLAERLPSRSVFWVMRKDHDT